jgi:hypothetical protein
MKTACILTSLLLTAALATAQNPLVGTWELVSIKATDTAKNKIELDQSAVREMKVITPTHYMLITHRVSADTLIFDKAIAGTIKITGNKFVETPLYTSNEGDLKVKTDFTWKVQGDKFTESGSITFPDGKKIVLQELVFQRVKSGESFVKNASIGSWDQLASGFEFADGSKGYHTKLNATRFQIITPTHWARIHNRDGKFESAFLFSYTIEGGAMEPVISVASFKHDPEDKTKTYIDQQVVGDILYFNGRQISGEGKELMKWEDVFLRVGK